MSIYFTSDLHFNDAFCMRANERPFRDATSMTDTIIENYNEIVKGGDTCFILGDMGSFDFRENLRDILKDMNGTKHLILGNHDRNLLKKDPFYFEDIGFDQIYDYPIVYDDFYMLSHEPLHMTKLMPYVNIHGHYHTTRFTQWNYVNVSVDMNNFKPVSFDEIKDKVERKYK